MGLYVQDQESPRVGRTHRGYSRPSMSVKLRVPTADITGPLARACPHLLWYAHSGPKAISPIPNKARSIQTDSNTGGSGIPPACVVEDWVVGSVRSNNAASCGITAGYVVPGALSKNLRIWGEVAGIWETFAARNDIPVRIAPARLMSRPVDRLTVLGSTIFPVGVYSV